MATDEQGSISRLLVDLKAGDAQAVQPLWERYFDRLVRLARVRLATGRRGAEADEEDAALSAFDSFCTGATHGRFPQLGDREDLWKLLVVITARKVAAQLQRRRAQKRGGGRVAATPCDDADLLDAIVGHEPTPDFAAEVAEQYRLLLDRLADDGLRHVAVWRLEGYSNDEIAEKLGCARRTVARRLDLIRRIWLEAEEPLSHGIGTALQ